MYESGLNVYALAQTPGPDLGYHDAAMESQVFISSENSCMCTSLRASRSRPGLGTGRAGWLMGLIGSSEPLALY